MARLETVIGLHAVESALRSDPRRIVSLHYKASRRDRRLAQLLALAREVGVEAHQADERELARLADGGRHQGVVARCRAVKLPDEDALFARLETLDEAPLLLVLDGVTDPHNLGACLRTADAAGVHAVIIPRDNAVGLTPAARKVASGAADSVLLVQVTNLSRTLEKLQRAGVWIVGTAGDAETSLYEQDLTGPLAIVMGAEGKGLRRLTRERCDYLVSLPMRGQVESLNISVATGICLYEALRQR